MTKVSRWILGPGLLSVALACGTSDTSDTNDTIGPSPTPCEPGPSAENACMTTTCSDGVPRTTPAAANVPCATGVCDGAGACVACNDATHCPGAAGECQKTACIEHRCVVQSVASGTALGASSQTPGDCKKAVCDGNGATTLAASDDDLPNDGNACTTDTCSTGVPKHTTNVGMACTHNAGAGKCGSSAKCLKAPELAVVDVTNAAVKVFTAVDTADGDVAPARALSVGNPRAALMDGQRDLLYVTDLNTTAVRVFSPRTSSGASASVRSITGVGAAICLALDVARDLLIVGSDTSGGTVYLFKPASTLDGAAVPVGTITGLPSVPYHIFYDAPRDRLFVEYGNTSSIDVIDTVVASVVGTVARASLTVRTIAGAATTMATPLGLTYDASRDHLYVGNAGAGASILVFAGASALSGNVAPTRTIAAAFQSPRGLHYDVELDELYVTSQNSPSIKVIGSAHTANGTVMPARTIVGANVALAQPVDAFFFRPQ